MLARNLMVGPPPHRLGRQHLARCDAQPFAFDIRDRQLAGDRLGGFGERDLCVATRAKLRDDDTDEEKSRHRG